jgi:serine/alanine adding enzyme
VATSPVRHHRRAEEPLPAMLETYTLTTIDADQWRAVLPADVCVLGSLEYARIQEVETGWPARLFVVQDGIPVAAYPYFLRETHTLPFADDRSKAWSDISTSAYTGPLWLGETAASDAHTPAASFPDLFARHCRDNGIIAEFAHLNPWVSRELLDLNCVRPNREIIYIDLSWDEEEIWMRSLSSDARRQTKQGLKAGVQIRRTVEPEDVREFHRLYSMTMDRHEASDRYRFQLEYFLKFAETMSGNAFFVLAEYEGRAVAAGLFMHDQNDIYWHLSAADRDWGRVRPVNVYLFDTIRYSLGQHWKRMILGGAFQDGDGVFRFKANFSRLRAEFNTYERIHAAEPYESLTTDWRSQGGQAAGNEHFFPLYRAAITSATDGTVAHRSV